MRLFRTLSAWWRGERQVAGHRVSPLWVVPILTEPAEDDPTLRKDWPDIHQCLQKETRSDQPQR